MHVNAREREGERAEPPTGGAWLETAALLAIWGVTIAALSPRGDFPLHDDWDFAVATFRFARTGHFHFTAFTAVSLRAMVLWGAAWVRLFGESFEVLRLSTLTASAATIAVLHRTLRHAGVARFGRLLAPMALLANPIFLWASCTYMTDVPFVFVSAIAFLLLLRALQEARLDFFAGGNLAIVVASFIRQNGVVPLAALLVLLLWFRVRLTERWRAFAAIAVATLLLFSALLLFKRDWISGSPEMFALHYQMWGETTFRLPEQIAVIVHYTIFNAINCSIFFLPLVLPLVVSARVPSSRARAIGVAAIAALVVWRVADLATSGFLVPYTSRAQFSDILPGAVFFDLGIGTPNLFDTFNLGYSYPFAMPHALRLGLTTIAAIGAIVLLCRLGGVVIEEAAGEKLDRPLLLAVAWAAAGTAALFASGYYYDRYSLDSAWTVAIAAALLVPWTQRASRGVAIVAVAGLLLFSTLAVQEYFRWNRARWTAFDSLRHAGTAVTEIDGGAEAQAYYELANASRKEAHRPHLPRRYAITFHPLPRFHIVRTYPFRGFLGAHRGSIYLLQRDE